MANDLVRVETLIKEGDAKLDKAVGYEEKAENMRISAGKTYLEARELAYKTAPQTGKAWLDCLAEFSTRSTRDVQRVMKIAASANPTEALAEEREANKQQRAEKKSEMRHRDVAFNTPPAVEDDPFADDGDFVGGVPSTDVIEPEVVVDPVEAIMTRVKALSTEEFKRLMAAIGQEAIALGLAKPKDEPRVRVVPPRGELRFDPRVVRAVELFFLLPEARQTWVEQRMQDEPERVAAISVEGDHVAWAKAFALLPDGEANAIVNLIKITRERNRK